MSVIDNKVKNKIKGILADHITKDYKEILMRNKAATKVTSIIDSLQTDTSMNPILVRMKCVMRFKFSSLKFQVFISTFTNK